MSVDGKIAPANYMGREFSQFMKSQHEQMLHSIRAGVDAVIVGVNAVVADDPSLTVRAVEGKNPLRVVIDSQARTPINSKILDTEKALTLIAVAKDAPKDKIEFLRSRNVAVMCSSSLKRVDLKELLVELSIKWGVKRVLVEGGGEVRWSFFEQGLVDELFVWIMPTIWGGRDAPTLVEGSGFLKAEEAVNLTFKSIDKVEDIIILWFNTKP